ncbi:hypothetical protein Hypma_010625 [Hypsizygus marmoreus]|uniref:F-box domain-containing protein n=1 Tax=Hypsizygus marmoreus TaxID=39966 RepID=A0A369JJA3_HYPMA|nr:hypothetical protein Hypma_010625 [Hypsizygus marmoreus]
MSSRIPTIRQSKLALPAEMILDIISRCATNELAVCALANSTFKVEAERRIYRKIVLTSVMGPRLSQCLETLATVPKKAALVRYFSTYRRLSLRGTPLAHLGKALINMVSLDELRLPMKMKSMVVDRALQHCTFSLKKLCISMTSIDSPWLLKQASLTSIGVYEFPSSKTLPKILAWFQRLSQAKSANEVLIIYGMSIYSCRIDIITAFPVYTPAWSAHPIRSSLDNEAGVDDIYMFQVYLESLANEDVLRSVLGSIATYFSEIQHLYLRVRDANVHKYPALCWSADNTASDETYQQQRHLLAEHWARNSDTLLRVEFPDGGGSNRNMETGVWGV